MLRAVAAFAIILGAFTMTAPEAFASGPRSTADAPRAAHSDWSGLLAKYTVPGPDGVTRFNYGALQAHAADRGVLDAYIAQFEDADLSGQSPEAFASWANIYNAVTVRYIIERYPVKSIRDGFIIGPWKRIKVQAGGRNVSLDQIEHEIMRKTWPGPDVHYALNCASISCPNLLAKAWEALTLEADLDEAAKAYVNNPRGVTVGERGLTVSQIYKWFEDDFGGSKAGVIDHLLIHAGPSLAEHIRANPRIVRYQYDWSLNDAVNTGG